MPGDDNILHLQNGVEKSSLISRSLTRITIRYIRKGKSLYSREASHTVLQISDFDNSPRYVILKQLCRGLLQLRLEHTNIASKVCHDLSQHPPFFHHSLSSCHISCNKIVMQCSFNSFAVSLLHYQSSNDS